MCQIQLTRMAQLDEAVDPKDDLTGLTDAAARRKRQNRLNVRIYRRRKHRTKGTLLQHPLSVLPPTISTIPSQPNQHCSSAALQVLPSPPATTTLPPSLQRTVPHEEWVDLIPHPVWRDNVLLALERFDECALWADSIGGLFDGFPDAKIERRGVICWASPRDSSGGRSRKGSGVVGGGCLGGVLVRC